MRVTKIFETHMDISDTEKLYQPLTVIVMEELKNKFEKRCYKSSYIIEIKEINHISQCEISTNHQQCIGMIDVMFTALVEIYTPGNIIPVCKLEIKRNNGEFIAESEDAQIQLVANENDKILPAFKVGDIFPIQVKAVNYGPFQRKMTVVGCLPEIKPEPLVIYKIVPSQYKELFRPGQLNAIEQFVSANNNSEWISSLSAADKKKMDEYVAVTYPYKDNKTSAIPKTSQFNFTDSKEISALADIKQPFYIYYPPETSRSRPIANIVTDPAAMESYKNLIVEERPMVIITEFITIYYNYMEMIKSLTENYPSPTSARYRALWGIIHLGKES